MKIDLVCGTRGLEKAVRKAIRKPRIGDILRGGPTVSLHIEGFGSGVSIYEEEFLCNNFGLIFMLYSEFPPEKNVRKVDRKKMLGISIASHMTRMTMMMTNDAIKELNIAPHFNEVWTYGHCY